jgi:hypothetical protein
VGGPAGAIRVADRAVRLCHRPHRARRVTGSRIELAEGRVPPLVVRVLDGRLTCRDREALARLRDGLDRMM